MRRYGLCVLSALVFGAFSPDHVHADMLDDWDGWTFNMTLENDMFGSDTDRHYTHGTRFSLAAPEGEVADWLRDAAGYFPFFPMKEHCVPVMPLGKICIHRQILP